MSALDRPIFYATTLVNEVAAAATGAAAAVGTAVKTGDWGILLDTRYGVYAASIIVSFAWPFLRAAFTAGVSDVRAWEGSRESERERCARWVVPCLFCAVFSHTLSPHFFLSQPIGRRFIFAAPAAAAATRKGGRPSRKVVAPPAPTQKQLDRLFKWNGEWAG